MYMLYEWVDNIIQICNITGGFKLRMVNSEFWTILKIRERIKNKCYSWKKEKDIPNSYSIPVIGWYYVFDNQSHQQFRFQLKNVSCVSNWINMILINFYNWTWLCTVHWNPYNWFTKQFTNCNQLIN